MRPRTVFSSVLLFSLGCCLLFAAAASAQQQQQQQRTANTPAELARVSAAVAGSTASLIPCVWTDFVATLERAAITGTWGFHESGGCDAWTAANLLEAFGGDAGALYDSITQKLFTLPDDTKVWPGHDYKGFTVSTIGREKAHNPRLAGKSRGQFIELMGNLHLPKPRLIDVAVPANRRLGIPHG